MYVINAKLNTRLTDNKATRSAYEIYYGKQTAASTSYILDSDLLKKARTEYGLTAVEDLMNVVGLKDPNVLITLEEVHDLIRDADELYDKEATLCEAANRTKDCDDLKNFGAEKRLEFLVHSYADRVMARVEQVEQDGVQKDEADKKAKSGEVA